MADTNVIAPEDVQFTEPPAISSQDVTVHGNDAPSLETQDPATFAGLTTQRAIPILYQQGGMPSGETVQRIYEKALDSANEFRKSHALATEQAQLELQKRQAALPILGAEKAVEAGAELEKEKQLQQWQQTGEVHRAAQQDTDRINGFLSGYDTADKLQQYHTNMAATTPGAGGWLKSHILGFAMQPDITSQPTKDFDAYLESAIVPLGRGVFGDAATAATKESIQANMRSMLANKDDNPLSAGHKTFMIKDRIMQNLINDRATAVANHTDPAPWDAAIGKIIGDYNSQQTQEFAPRSSTDLVQVGNSPAGRAQVAAAATGQPAGPNTVGAAARQPGNQVWSPAAPAPTVVPPGPIGPPSPAPTGYQAPPSLEPDVGAQLRQGVRQLLTPGVGPPQETTSNPPDLSSPNPYAWGQ